MADQELEKGYHDFKARPGRKKVTVIGAGNVGATTAAQQIVAARPRRRRADRHRRGPARRARRST